MPEQKIEKQMQEQNEALVAMRDAVKEIKSLGMETKAGASEAKEKADRANEMLDKIETKNQEVMAKINAERKAAKEAEELVGKEIKSLQEKIAKLSTIGSGGSANPDMEQKVKLMKEMKSLSSFAHNAKAHPEEYEKLGIEMKYFRSDVNADGGFLMEESYDDRIRRKITEISPIRQISSTKIIQGLAENLFVEAQDFEAFWTAEGQQPFTESNQTFSQPKIPLHGITVKTSQTNKAAMGSRFNFETMVAAGFRRVRLKKEGAAHVNGDGVDKPTGFMNAKAGLSKIQSTTASNFTANDLIDLTGQLKEGYNAQYVFNRKTLSKIRQMTFPNGEQFWQPGNLGAGVPNTINGEPYTLVPDMADIAADAYPVAYGDFLEGFEIVDATMANFLRNPYIKDGYVVYTLEAYTGSDVVMPEAIIKLQCGSAA